MNRQQTSSALQATGSRKRWRALWQTCLVAVVWCVVLATPARAEECGPAQDDGVRHCRTGLDAAQIQRMALISQEKSNWCWAASIAMVFAHHGHTLAQQEIVRRRFGAELDERLPGDGITQLVGQIWRDPNGGAFQGRATPGEAAERRFRFGNDTVIRELAQGRPMIVGTLGHAVVLVGVEYERFTAQDAVRITGATVIDPMPGRGLRRLTAAELRPSYVTAVQVVASATVARVQPAQAARGTLVATAARATAAEDFGFGFDNGAGAAE